MIINIYNILNIVIKNTFYKFLILYIKIKNKFYTNYKIIFIL